MGPREMSMGTGHCAEVCVNLEHGCQIEVGDVC